MNIICLTLPEKREAHRHPERYCPEHAPMHMGMLGVLVPLLVLRGFSAEMVVECCH